MNRRAIVVALVLALVAGGCGSRQSRDNAGTSNATSKPGVGGSNATTGTIGTMTSPCGPGDASGATDVGVSDDKIVITTISDPGGPLPGLNKSVFDAMQAFEKWCNDQGGINGRSIEVKLADAKLFNYQEVVAQACTDSFALVGGIGGMDSMGAQTQVDCDLINIPAAAVNPEQTMADLTYEPLPNPTTDYGAGSGKWIASRYPQVLDAAAALRTGVSTTRDQSNRLIAGYEQLGYHFVFVKDTNLPETNWAPLVLAMKNAGIEYVTLTVTWEEALPMQKEMAQQHFKPAVTEFEANFYDANYAKQGGEFAEGTLVRLMIWPFEEADQNPATTTYMNALQAAVPGASPALLGVQAWSAALLWARSVAALGSNVTREGVGAEISKVHDWTAGGLHPPTDPGSHLRSSCFIMMSVHDGAFVREYPKPDADRAVYEAGHGYACDPDGIVPIQGDPSKGARKH